MKIKTGFQQPKTSEKELDRADENQQFIEIAAGNYIKIRSYAIEGYCLANRATH